MQGSAAEKTKPIKANFNAQTTPKGVEQRPGDDL